MAGQTKQTVFACMFLCFRLAFGDNIPKIIVNDWTLCDASKNVFVTFWDLSVMECMLECDKRKRCKALNFTRHVNKCELLETDSHDETEVDKQWCIHIRKADHIGIYPVPSQCTDCAVGQTCVLLTGSCQPEECEKLSVSHGAIAGNLNHIGSTAITMPEIGYTLGDQSPRSVCLSNGSWDNIPVPQMVDCGPPKTIPHALISQFTVYGTRSQYFCRRCRYVAMPSSARRSITCGPDGEWSTPDEFRCILSWEVIAKTGKHYHANYCKNLNYQDAKNYCEENLDHPAHIANVTTQDEYDTVEEFLEPLSEVTWYNYTVYGTLDHMTRWYRSWWIGINIDNTTWVNNGTQTSVNVTDLCIELIFGQNETKWNDTDCTYQNYPVCERSDVP